MANRYFNQFLFSLHKMLTQIDCSFQVARADAGGLGLINFKGPGVLSAFMHTTQTPGVMNGVTNPNPTDGGIIINLEDNYTKMLGFDTSFQMVAGAALGTALKIDNGATLTVGTIYVISTLGDATAAQWTLVGVPAGVTPAVGVAFAAIATGGGAGNTSTSRVSPSVTASTLGTIEMIGKPDLANKAIVKGAPRSQLLLQCRDFAGAIVTPLDGVVINLGFQFVNSSAFTPQE